MTSPVPNTKKKTNEKFKQVSQSLFALLFIAGLTITSLARAVAYKVKLELFTPGELWQWINFRSLK